MCPILDWETARLKISTLYYSPLSGTKQAQWLGHVVLRQLTWINLPILVIGLRLNSLGKSRRACMDAGRLSPETNTYVCFYLHRLHGEDKNTRSDPVGFSAARLQVLSRFLYHELTLWRMFCHFVDQEKHNDKRKSVHLRNLSKALWLRTCTRRYMRQLIRLYLRMQEAGYISNQRSSVGSVNCMTL